MTPAGFREALTGSLRRQLTIGAALLIAATMALFVWDVARRQEASAVAQQHEEARALTRSLATSSAVWVASRDVSGLQEIVDGFAAHPGMSYVMVLDGRGQVLAHSDPARRGLYLSDLPEAPEWRLLRQGSAVVDVVGPVVLAGRPIGWARVGLSRGSLDAALARIVRNGIAYGTFAAALGSLLAWLAGRVMTRRLKAIQDVADAVQRGDATVRAVVPGNDEAARLAAGFNDMLDTLAQRERALEEALRQLQLVTNRVPGIIVFQFRLGPDGRTSVPYASEALYEIYRIRPEEIRADARRLHDVVHPDDLPLLNESFEESATRLTPLMVEHRLKFGEEPESWVLVNAMPQPEGDGSVLWYGFVTDVTERRRASESLRETAEALRRSEETYRSLFHHMLNGLAYCRMIFEGDRPVDWVYLEVNESFVLQTGLDGITGRKVSEVIPGVRETSPELLDIYGRVARTGQPERFEFFVGGLNRWFSVAAFSPSRDHFVAVFDVITERKEAERILLQSHEEMEARVAERTKSLAEANRELEAFSYAISHELRTPLRAIDGHSALVVRNYEELLDDEGRRHLSELRWNAQRMGRLIDDLLAFSRTGRTDLKFGPVNMADLAKAAFEAIVHSSDARSRPAFTVGHLPDAVGDVELLSRVWENLLSNAVKFSAGRDAPRIHVEGSLEGQEALYKVRDNGVGFDTAYGDRLFRVFGRLHGHREFEGTGVGLALVKRIVERHRGRVWAEGAVSEGVTVSFTLPLK